MSKFSPFDATLWYATAAPPPATVPLEGRVQADVCVVGAGFFGLTGVDGYVWFAFLGAAAATLPLQCTYDLEVAASRYFHALRTGTIPLQFLFSGTIFGTGPLGLQVQHVSWDCEDSYEMPVSVWRALIGQHYPDTGWLRLRHDSIAALSEFKSRLGLLDLDDAIRTLMAAGVPTSTSTNGPSAPGR